MSTQQPTMITIMFVSMLLLGETCGSEVYSEAGPERTESEKRLDHLERSLLQEQERNAHQEELLRLQNAKLVRMESLLRHQEGWLRQQDAKLSQRDQLLMKYEQLLQRQQANQMDNPSLFRKRPISPKTKSFSERRHHKIDENMSKTVFETTVDQDRMMPASHDVISRSDDGGALQVVVDQISQRVTKMTADILALKTKTAADIETLKSHTNTEIQALKVQTQADVQTLHDRNSQQDHGIRDAGTSTFVHWGSSQCSNSSELIYSGVVGGSYYGHAGAAANYLCLTLSPVFNDDHRFPSSNFEAFLYGSEYETEDSHDDKDPLCAVCRSTSPTTVMIPGTNQCTPGWHLQYSGYLMADKFDHAGGYEYICVDSKFETRMGSDADQDAAVMHFTVTRCGSLPCGPYVNNKMVTCAVCSK